VWFVTAVIAAVSLLSPGAFAKPVAKEDAATAVSVWLKQPGRGLKAPIGNAVRQTETFTDAAGNPEYYVVYLNPSGFVIAPADDLVEPIVFFSPAGRYVASDKNPLGALVMRDIPARLAQARAQQPAAAAQARFKEAQRKWAKFRAAAAAAAGPVMSPPSSVSDVRVAPLTLTTWDQSYAGTESPGPPDCYNYYTPPGPPGSQSNYVCGCVATAMAQLMYYTWSHDSAFLSNGVGTVPSYYYIDGVKQPTVNLLGGDGNGGPYDWADMVLSPSASITTTQSQAIGALCYDAGVAVNMEYDTDGKDESGASVVVASSALTSVFNYSNSICGGDGSDNIGAGLTTMLNSNLDAGLPCLLGIFAPGVGHCIVPDGYGYDSGTLYHHLNMGWSGYDNGWYNLPVFDADYDWTTVANCVYNIYTSGSGEIISGRVLEASGNPVSEATVQAVRTGGGTWTTTTNANGIYAFAKVPSAATYTLSAAAPGQTYASLTATTGTSAPYNNTTGNVWGEDFIALTPLAVQSTPPTGIAITSDTGQAGTTNYTVPSVAYGASVDLVAPATDPTGGYSFSNWTLNGAAQTAGAVEITPTMPASAMTAVAVYTANNYALTVDSTPPTGIVITSSTGDDGTTDYTVPSVAYGASVDLVAPPTDPTGGYSFSYWTVNGTPQAAGAMEITPTMPASAMTAVAVYTVNTYALTVQSTPPTGIVITSGTGDGGTTDYTVSSVAYGTSVDLVAPATDPTGGYAFSYWTLNGTPQTAGLLEITPTMPASAMTAVAVYTVNTFAVTVQSTPPTGIAITSDTGDGGTTNYTVPSVAYGTSVDLTAPATDANLSYTFSQWTLNGVAQTAGQQALTFTMTADTTAVAQYTQNNLTLAVQSTPPTGLSIGSSTGDGGTTNYTVANLALGTSLNLAAPATDPTGYTFSQWTLNGAAQTAGQKSVTFAAPASLFLTWGSAGSGNGQFDDPWGIALDSAGNVYVADGYNQRIQKFTSAGAYVTQWGSYGSGNGQLEYPDGIAVDGAGNVYVADYQNCRVEKFTSIGAYLTQWGSDGSDNGQFSYPAGIAVDTAGNVYVADTSNQRIQKFTSAGAYATRWGSYGSGNGQFEYPVGIAVDGAGNVYVTDQYNGRIQKFTSAGAYLTQWGSAGSGNGQFDSPFGIAVDGAGNVYVADTWNQRIQKLASAGAYLTQWGSYGSGNGQFEYPIGIAVDGAGNVYVADNNNDRVQVFGQNILAVAEYTVNNYALTVQSTPPTGIVITSGTGDGGTTDYTVSSVAYGTSVDLVAPATDPTGGYSFSYWTLNGTPQAPDLLEIAPTMPASAMTAVAVYTANTYALTVQSTPPTGLGIGSGAGDGGTTDYTVSSVAYGTSVDLVAPATDPTGGYSFSYWTLNGVSQTLGAMEITPTMPASAMTAVAVYTLNTYALTVQSTPPTGIVITSGTGDGGTTDYTVPTVAYGTSVDLVAPATDPTGGYSFSYWTLNGVSQTAGAMEITPTMPASAMTAEAVYTANSYTLTVQSTPPTGIVITSGTGDGGTTDYTVPTVAYGTSVDLVAPATDPTGGYSFVYWTLNGTPQAFGAMEITPTMPASAMTAVAVYRANSYALTVQSTPPTGLGIGSGTGDGGTTNYTVPTVAYGTSVNLVAPATDPTGGYSFVYWTLNGTPQAFGAMEITPTMPASAMTAVAVYTANSYALTVESTPPTGIVIASDTGDGGTTNYTVSSVAYGTSVDLVAPATDPTGGYSFSYWTLNGVSQTAGVVEITPTMPASAMTAVAVYTTNSYTLAVQSTPLTGIAITSSTSTAEDGTTNYTAPGIQYGTTVNLEAPATDPAGYTFSQWTLTQTGGQNTIAFMTSGDGKSITFSMPATDTTAVAQYTTNRYTLTVESTPPTGLGIASGTGDGGLTNYTVPSVAYGTSVDLVAPATDPTGGYSFSYWTVNGTSQTAGAMEITPTMPASAMTALAVYTVNTYALTVQSTPPTGLVIGSTSGDGGTTNYTAPSVAYGTSVNLAAPATDPTGYTFSNWTVSGAAQSAGVKNITFTMPAVATTAAAVYTVSTYTLTVQSTPPTGLSIGSTTGDGGTTNYTVSSVAYGTSVNLAAPATEPTGYTFSKWTVKGVAQTAGKKSITFTLTGATAAVAQYTANTYKLTVQSTPPTGLSIGSTTGDGGTTKYTKSGVAYGASVNLAAPATDPTGYTFSMWTVGGSGQTAGQKSITFPMPASATTAVAQYTLNTYALTVQSTPPTGIVIASDTGEGGTTGYTVPSVAYGASVDLVAPATDPTGYTFSQWMVNDVAQTAGQKSITFTMPAAATTAVAQYTLITYTLSVQSAPLTGIYISGTYPGTTNYTVPSVAYGAIVTLSAPLAASGNNFQKWQENGADYSTNPTITVAAGNDTYTAVYLTPTAGYMLAVQSTPPIGLSIGSSTGHGGTTTNYSIPGVGNGTSVNLAAPATDPTGYTFSQWTLNGAAQSPGQKSVTFKIDAAVTAVARYTANAAYTLTVESTPTGVSIGSSNPGQGGTTNYTKKGIAYGASVNLATPATDPTGYSFSQWTLNGVAQTAGQKRITFTMNAAVTAVAQYAPSGYALTVESTPPTGVGISSTTGQKGTTNYGKNVTEGTSVNLAAPAKDPAGYTFSQWTLNGAAQTAGLKNITFTMPASATTAVAQYTLNGYALMVQSTPPAKLAISSSTGQGGTTNYTEKDVPAEMSVNLEAPAADPKGYTFSQWTLNGAAQTDRAKSITFTMDAAVTAVAEYTANTSYMLSVQSTPPAKLIISSSTGQAGTTNYTEKGVPAEMSVNLEAPATDPKGYTFSQWTVNGAAQPFGQKSVAFTMDGAVTAVAKYNPGYTLSVQATPPKGLSIGSSTGQGGTTNYTTSGVAYGASVNLQAPETDPAGYTFSQWTVNGAAQTDGQKAITFTMDAAVTAVAHYTANPVYKLSVQSTPKGQLITSSTSDGGTTPYTVSGVTYGTSVNLQAPETDATGLYTFSQWTLNGAAQTPGENSITLTVDGAVTAMAQYTANVGYALTVESMPPTGLSIGSTLGQGGTTDYTEKVVAAEASVNLEAPDVDPTGYTFSQWTVNGAAQTLGQKSITFVMDGAVTAVAEYTPTGDALTVESTPPTGVSISSSTGQAGVTNYGKSVESGADVNLEAPTPDPAGYTFSEWTLNGVAQTAGAKSITFTMTTATTAVAQYTLNGYTLNVQSTPPAKLAIGSSTDQGGTTRYTVTKVGYGTSVNLQAPGTDPTGYTFSQWTLNGAAQTDGQKGITFTMDATVTAVAHYTANPLYTLTVQSTPPVKLAISSSTGQGGTTNYTKSGIAYGASVNLAAPATAPTGYTFSQWTLNGAAQTDGQKGITFTMDAAVTAVAHYTANVEYVLTVQSTPPTGVSIGSSTGQGGTTNYTKSGIAYGASVDLQAPVTDPAGYIFSQWAVNGAAQPAGQKGITFIMEAATTAEAVYVKDAP
jgi:hypothetical protein